MNKEIIPLYSRIYSILKHKILSGQYDAGEKLPIGNIMAEKYGVSKITITGALARLESEGLIIRIPGKGTFVSENIPIPEQSVFTDFQDILNDRERFKVNLISFKKIPVKESRYPRAIRNFMKLSQDDTIYLVQRTRERNGIPILFAEVYLPVQFGEIFSTNDLIGKETIIGMLQKKASISVGRGERYIEAVPAEEDIAEILQGQPSYPMILLQTFFSTTTGEPMEMSNNFMKADFFKYRMDINVSETRG